MLTVLASILGSYDFQLAPVLSMLLPFLHMSHARLRLVRHVRRADFRHLAHSSAARWPIATAASSSSISASRSSR